MIVAFMKAILLRRVFFLCLVLTTSFACAKENTMEVVIEGRSRYVILTGEDAPQSVREAALELQDCIRESTGVELKLVHQAETEPVISIGETSRAQQAGVVKEDAPPGSYQIIRRGEDLYIIGPDTPDEGWTENGGMSHGSANGVYAFLEEMLDVRWLLPGEDGRDLPQRKEWRPQVADHIEVIPTLTMRELSHLSDFATPEQTAIIRTWMRRQRLGSSDALRHPGSHRGDHWQHNWAWITDDPEMFKTHPQWFAMNAAGERWNPGNHYTKLETTDPELIRFFADRAIATLKASDRPRYFSLTPNDAPSRWSESPESRELYDPAIGEGRETAELKPRVPSKSSLVAKWYYDVASQVAKEYPEGKVTGFIYSDYLYPPVKFSTPLPDNLSLIFCAPNYGYELNLPEARQRLEMLLEAWKDWTPNSLYYYDIPALLLRQEDSDARYNFPGTTALITPTASETLRFLSQMLDKHKIKGAYLYGAASWSNAGLSNYMIARLLWKPGIDPRAIETEWLNRAYGPVAGDKVARLYRQLDDDYRSFGYIGYNLTGAMMETIYARRLAEMEQLALEALDSPMTAVQKRRFDAWLRNIVALQWRLRNMGLLEEGYQSALTRTDEEVIALLESPAGDYPAFPGIIPGEHAFSAEKAFAKVRMVETLTQGETPELQPTTAAVIYANKASKVTIMPQKVEHGAYVATYQVNNARNEVVARGILQQGRPVTFDAEAGQAYTFSMPPRERRSRYPTRCELLIEAAEFAGVVKEDEGVVIRKREATLYVWSDKAGAKDSQQGVVIKK